MHQKHLAAPDALDIWYNLHPVLYSILNRVYRL